MPVGTFEFKDIMDNNKDVTIDIKDPTDLEFWAAQLNVETAKIIEAVNIVGNSSVAVKEHLRTA